MDRPNTILVYSDYKSPYAFLAKDLIYASRTFNSIKLRLGEALQDT
jgi:hypothetical protein